MFVVTHVNYVLIFFSFKANSWRRALTEGVRQGKKELLAVHEKFTRYHEVIS